MKFSFSRYNLSPSEARWERFFQILPGAISWSVIIGMTVFAVMKPLYAAVVIIAFDFYWLMRLFYVTIFLLISYFRLSLEDKTDWNARIRELDLQIREGYGKTPKGASAGFRQKFSDWLFRRQLSYLKKSRTTPPAPSDELLHLVIIPCVRETRNIMEPGIRSLAHGNYPSKRILVIIAVEGRSEQEVKDGAASLAADYHGQFYDFLVITHPDGIPGEAKVKGANISYAGRRAETYFQEKGIDFAKVIVSCFDADTVVSPNYFSCLTYYFMVSPARHRASFQPIPVYHNNIWEAPGFARVLEMGSSFFQLTEATNSEKLVTFSSHSMSFKALVEIGFWPVDMISDDSAIFWKAYIHYDGKYRVIPMYVTLSMDIADGSSFWKSAVNVYKQKRRWAWGVENFPIVMRAFMKESRISLYNKLRHGFKLIEGHLAWATWPFLLGIIGWLPVLFSRKEFSDSVLYYSVQRITGTIFNLASLCLVITIILSLCLLPKRKIKHSLWIRIGHAFEWLLVPVIALFFSGLPALDAQTRLMRGKYMEFWVTAKNRTK